MDDEHNQQVALPVDAPDSSDASLPLSVGDLNRRVAPRRSARTVFAVVGAAAVVAVLAVGLVIASNGDSHAVHAGVATGTNSSPATDAQTMSRLWLAAQKLAKANGGTVLNAEAVKSTHAKAVRATMGDGVQGDQPVWVIQVEGSEPFVCGGCRGPVGAKAPTGRYLVSILDATTFQASDFGIGPVDADLGQLGPVVVLHG